MKPMITLNKLALFISWITSIIIVILPFHAFLTVWLSSVIGNYTALRLWKEALLVIIFSGAVCILIKDKKIRKEVTSKRLTQVLFAYLVLLASSGAIAYWLDKVTPKALGFGMIINLRFIFFFFAVWIIAKKSQLLQILWPKLLLIPAALVIAIGLLQRIVLPFDVLKHFGYSPQTIFPYQTINYDINYPRIMSTLRGANPLGAYLILILSAAAVYFIKFKQKRLLWGLFGLVGLLVLFFSYSRGAWIGIVFSGMYLAWFTLRKVDIKRLLLPISFILLVTGITVVLSLRDNHTIENYLFHTSDRSTIEESSNEAHFSAFKNGVRDIIHEPLGRGVGTAGPASVYNGKVRVAENYFIQLAQEAGWLGLALFAAINVLVAQELWMRRREVLPRVLLASLIGITAVNLVSHAWTDDTLAYIWWGLAGIALAPVILTGNKHKRHEKAKQTTT